MGAVDLVLQVESPKSVTAGPAAHRPRRPQRRRRPRRAASSRSSAPTCSSARSSRSACARALIETTVVPRNPLDVLAQQIVAMARRRPRTTSSVDALHALRRRARYTYAELSRAQLENVLDMLDGRYPSEEFGELRPRIVWDRVAGTIRARKGSRALAITNAGTIPDRGLFSRQPARRPPRRRARRGDGLRGAAGPGVPARRVVVADRGDHARPRDRHARARRPRRGAVLEGRRPRAPARARRGDRRVRALGGRPGRRRRSSATTTSTRGRPRNLLEFLREQQDGDARDPERPHDRDRALPRRDRRLARCASSRPTAAACTPPGASR